MEKGTLTAFGNYRMMPAQRCEAHRMGSISMNASAYQPELEQPIDSSFVNEAVVEVSEEKRQLLMESSENVAAGRAVDNDIVMDWLDSLLTDNPLPTPEP